MSKFTCYKNTKENIDKINIKDGQMLVATDEKAIYFDHNNERIEIKSNTTQQTGTVTNFKGDYLCLPRYCVNYGNTKDSYDYEIPYLFDEELNFFIDEENPLLLTFANGKSKLFTSIVNNAKNTIKTAILNQPNTPLHYLIYIDENGIVDCLNADDDFYKIQSGSYVFATQADKGFWVKIDENDYIDSFKRNYEDDTWEQSSILVIGEFILNINNDTAVKKVNTYQYNKNNFSDLEAKQVYKKLEYIKDLTNGITFELSKKNYKVNITSPGTVIKLVPPEILNYFSYSEDKQYICQFNLFIYIANKTATVNLIDINDSSIELAGDTIGSLGVGYYLIELYLDHCDTRFYGRCKYISIPAEIPLPDIDIPGSELPHEDDIL